MYKKIILIIIFVSFLVIINFKFKITNYHYLNILAKENSFYSVIREEDLEKIIDKKEFIYKDNKYNYEIINIDKTILNNQVLVNINIKTNLKYISQNTYKVTIKLDEITLLDYIFNYLRGKR